MSLRPTGRALAMTVADAVRERVRSAFRDASWFDSRIAGVLGLTESRVAAWWTTHANVPLYVLAHPDVPAAVAARIAALVIELRGDASAPVSVETDTAGLVSLVGRVLDVAGAALADGRVDARERDLLRKVIACVHDKTGEWMRRHGAPVRGVG